ncbi:MAG: glycosyltransferase family 4 protein [Chitinophagaceae bacterium]|nr:glycosyltransferase family 4 protein [Chitinophagaceae bacterium]
MTKTILFICNEYPPYPSGGIGSFVKNLAEFLQTKSCTCIVAGLYGIHTDIHEEINGVQVFRFTTTTRSGWLRGIRQSFADKKKLSIHIHELEQRYQPDFIETFEWSGPLYKKPNTRLIVRLHGSHTVHAMAQHIKPSRWIAFWEKRTYHMADKLVGVSKYILQQSEHCFGKTTIPKQILYNSINTEQFSPDHEWVTRDYELLFAGRFHEQKGVYELPALLKILFALEPKYRFVFLGHHSDQQKERWLQQFTHAEQERITFLQGITHSQLSKYYQTAQVVLVPSRGEAFGLVAAEAMSCGAVVAMNQVSSANELIDDEHDGILIDMKNPLSSAEKIHRVLQNTQQVKQIEQEARKKVLSKFSNRQLLEENYMLYTDNL